MKKPLVSVVVIAGIILLFCAAVYFIEPARSLPSFFPGYDKSLMKHHYKHGIGALLLGLAFFAFAWFQSGKKSQSEK